MTVILAFFSTFLGKSILAALGMTGIGMLRDTAWYKGIRAGWGKFCYRTCALISAAGNTRLGALWQPAEEFLLDFIGFGVERACAGFRSDNIEKTIDQLDRLRGVGSKTQADALEAKVASQIYKLHNVNPARDAQDAAMFHRAFQAGDASTKQKLEE